MGGQLRGNAAPVDKNVPSGDPVEPHNEAASQERGDALGK